jgi:hypothetical protein
VAAWGTCSSAVVRSGAGCVHTSLRAACAMSIPFQANDGSGAIQDSAAWAVCHINPQLIDTPMMRSMLSRLRRC